MTMTHADPPLRLDEPPKPGMATLTLVELRKMTDTRAGRWLLGVIALAGVVMVGVVVFAAPAAEREVRDMYVASLTGVAILLPVLGVLSVTTEWSQRTALTTFTLVPRRSRVVCAKMLAAVALAALSAGVGVVAAYVGRGLAGLAGRGEGGWTIPPVLLATTVLFCAVSVLIGVAFGMVFLNSPLAIVMNFLLPIIWTTLGETVRRLDAAAGWLDTGRTLNPLFETGMTAEEWARAGTSLVPWLLLPLAIGMVRISRSEVK